MFNENFFIKAWYENHWAYLLLLPFTWVFHIILLVRTSLYKLGILSSIKIDRPVIIVGNITVGGTGKTMLIIELAEALKQRGFKIGVVSRGYNGKSPVWPLSVTAKSNPILVGDEPVLISRRVGCPVVVAPDRVDACHTLLHRYDCDVILSDDGLQHYRLQRDIEIAVFDGERIMGNCHCLPAGPLREPPSRLKTVDIVVVKNADSELGVRMDIELLDLYDVENPDKKIPLSEFKGKKVHAVVGIGNPHGFIQELTDAGLEVTQHCYEDHHDYNNNDIAFHDDMPIIVTEKDAVKIRQFHPAGVWALPVKAKLPDEFYDDIADRLKSLVVVNDAK